jgi:hypothetical protein
MDAEQLAKFMRDRALLIEGNDSYNETSLRKYAEVAREREKKIRRIEELKKVYFNAGRWAGGAKDRVAREAFERIKGLEK